jgi:hypothetical protein
MPSFPDPAWFAALGRLMDAEGESFRRLGYAEVRFAIRVIDDESERVIATTGLEFEGYSLTRAEIVSDLQAFDPDFVICARRAVWHRMLAAIAQHGRPDMRGTLSSLALLGEELWLESKDQLREDKFYRVNQTLQEFFNLASGLPG